MSFSNDDPEGSCPCSIAWIISGASSVKRNIRLTYDWSTFNAHGRVAVPAADHPFHQTGHFRPLAIGACAAVLAQNGVDFVPGVLTDNRLVLTGVDILLMLDLSQIELVSVYARWRILPLAFQAVLCENLSRMRGVCNEPSIE